MVEKHKQIGILRGGLTGIIYRYMGIHLPVSNSFSSAEEERIETE